MSKKGEYLRALVTERLTAAAEEIFALFERTIVEYEEELLRSREENQRLRCREESQRRPPPLLLEEVLKPQGELHKPDAPPHTLLTCVDQGETGPSQITDSSQSVRSKEEFQWAAVKTESDDDTDNSEDWEAPCSSSAPQAERKHEPENGDHMGGETAVAPAQVNFEASARRQCCFCDDTFQTPQDLKKHMEIHALEIHMENLNRTKQSAEALRQSCQSYSAAMKPVALSLPRKTRSGPAHGPPFACPFCKRCFARKFDLRSHVLIHTGEKPFACSQCNMRFNRKSNLYRHFRNHSKKT